MMSKIMALLILVIFVIGGIITESTTQTLLSIEELGDFSLETTTSTSRNPTNPTETTASETEGSSEATESTRSSESTLPPDITTTTESTKLPPTTSTPNVTSKTTDPTAETETTKPTDNDTTTPVTITINTTDANATVEATTTTEASVTESRTENSKTTTTEASVTESRTENSETTTTEPIISSCNNFTFVVKHTDTGESCILTNMIVRINLRYPTNDSQTGNGTLTIPKETKITGLCGEKIAKMTLNWKESTENQTSDNDLENRITFQYVHDDIVFYLDFISIDVHLDARNFPKAKDKRMNGDTAGRHLRLFSTSLKHGMYTSKVESKINVTDQIDVIISDIDLIAFRGCVDDVKKIEVENINVGAIVGGIIVAVALVLVISYLIWCKREKDVKNAKNATDQSNSF